MIGEHLDIDPTAMDEAFLAGEEDVYINPRTALPAFEGVARVYGPFPPHVLAKAPLWLATHLAQLNKAAVMPPSWLTLSHVHDLLNEERSTPTLARLPPRFFSVSRTLLKDVGSAFKEPIGMDPRDAEELLNIVDQLEEIRNNKLEAARARITTYQDALDLTNVTDAELCRLRPQFSDIQLSVSRSLFFLKTNQAPNAPSTQGIPQHLEPSNPVEHQLTLQYHPPLPSPSPLLSCLGSGQAVLRRHPNKSLPFPFHSMQPGCPLDYPVPSAPFLTPFESASYGFTSQYGFGSGQDGGNPFREPFEDLCSPSHFNSPFNDEYLGGAGGIGLMGYSQPDAPGVDKLFTDITTPCVVRVIQSSDDIGMNFGVEGMHQYEHQKGENNSMKEIGNTELLSEPAIKKRHSSSVSQEIIRFMRQTNSVMPDDAGNWCVGERLILSQGYNKAPSVDSSTPISTLDMKEDDSVRKKMCEKLGILDEGLASSDDDAEDTFDSNFKIHLVKGNKKAAKTKGNIVMGVGECRTREEGEKEEGQGRKSGEQWRGNNVKESKENNNNIIIINDIDSNNENNNNNRNRSIGDWDTGTDTKDVGGDVERMRQDIMKNNARGPSSVGLIVTPDGRLCGGDIGLLQETSSMASGDRLGETLTSQILAPCKGKQGSSTSFDISLEEGKEESDRGSSLMYESDNGSVCDIQYEYSSGPSPDTSGADPVYTDTEEEETQEMREEKEIQLRRRQHIEERVTLGENLLVQLAKDNTEGSLERILNEDERYKEAIICLRRGISKETREKLPTNSKRFNSIGYTLNKEIYKLTNKTATPTNHPPAASVTVKRGRKSQAASSDKTPTPTQPPSKEPPKTRGRKTKFPVTKTTTTTVNFDLQMSYPKRRCSTAKTGPRIDQKRIPCFPTPWLTRSLFDDGHTWYKYGQSQLSKNSQPTCYFRCGEKGCVARRHVCYDDATRKVKNIYYGEHSHEAVGTVSCAVAIKEDFILRALRGQLYIVEREETHEKAGIDSFCSLVLADPLEQLMRGCNTEDQVLENGVNPALKAKREVCIYIISDSVDPFDDCLGWYKYGQKKMSKDSNVAWKTYLRCKTAGCKCVKVVERCWFNPDPVVYPKMVTDGSDTCYVETCTCVDADSEEEKDKKPVEPPKLDLMLTMGIRDMESIPLTSVMGGLDPNVGSSLLDSGCKTSAGRSNRWIGCSAPIPYPNHYAGLTPGFMYKVDPVYCVHYKGFHSHKVSKNTFNLACQHCGSQWQW